MLCATDGNPEAVVLESTHVAADLRDLAAHVILEQTYVNRENQPIEAVYTFPLPMAATLLGLTVTLDGRELEAHAVEKTEAEEKYEDAITDGDAAIMLQEGEPGLYSMNVGNLKPGETCAIRLRFAQVHRFSGDNLRFHLPTTLAPRYGDPVAAGLDPHQAPETVLDSGKSFSLDLRVSGSLAQAQLHSPSHEISVARDGEAQRIRLAKETAAMDRDFVLLLTPQEVPQGTGLLVQDPRMDGQGSVAMAAFLPRLAGDLDPDPLNLKIVVDCSGSMGGDSMAQAREALLSILDALRPGDYFSITAFGSTHKCLFPEQRRVDFPD
ncbi:MAG: VWA domain-containing protein, partial [Desulfovibrio sp.]